MPIYEYQCKNGHRYEEIVLAGDEAHNPPLCPQCLNGGKRRVSSPYFKLSWIPTVVDSAKEIWSGTPLEGTDGINSVHYKSDKIFVDQGK